MVSFDSLDQRFVVHHESVQLSVVAVPWYRIGMLTPTVAVTDPPAFLILAHVLKAVVSESESLWPSHSDSGHEPSLLEGPAAVRTGR